MATYVIGDVQGCFDSLMALLERVRFDETKDRIALAGDLVNRGPRSLDVLRWLRLRGDAATTVLGNHDLHLLRRAFGIGKAGKRDTLDAVLAADDRDELIDWLRRRPVLTRLAGTFAEAHVMVHGGLAPQWTLAEAFELAQEIEATLRESEESAKKLLSQRIEGDVVRWSGKVKKSERLALALRLLTAIRVCDADGNVDLAFADVPAKAPRGFKPWFAAKDRKSRGEATIVCGHWAALGFHREPGVLALDSGCVWGRELTAVRLDDGEVVRQRTVERLTGP